MKRWLAIVGLVVLAAALVFLNQGMKKSVVPDHDENEKPQQSQPQTAGPNAIPKGPETALPAEETLGDPATAKHHIEVGWVYDESNLQKPEKLTVPLQAIRDFIRHSGSSTSAEIVNLDVPVEDRTPAARAVTDMGIQVDGNTLYDGNISSAPMPAESIMKNLGEAVGMK